MGRIVVGIDGSAESRAALAWAVEEAGYRRATVEVVHAWFLPAVAFAPYGAAAVPVLAPGDLEKAADALLHDVIGEVVGDDRATVDAVLVEGHPADVLVTKAVGADLLVVGSRGHGGFAGLLLGSVSNHVVHHATCPVVVIRSTAS